MKKNILLLLLLLISGTQYAQDSTRDKNDQPESEATDWWGYSHNYRWAIKTDIANITSGDFNIIGELKLLKKLSVEAGAGYTLDYLLDLFQFDNSKVKLVGNTRPTGGFSTKATIKYYFYEGIEGWWLGATGYTRTNNYKHTYQDLTYNNRKSKVGFGLLIGRQFISRSGFFTEVYGGLSLVNMSRAYYCTGYNDVNVWEENVYTEEKKSTVNLLVGLRLGLGGR